MKRFLVKILGSRNTAFLRHIYNDFKRFYGNDFNKQNEILATAPYPVSLYEEVLNRLREDAKNVVVLRMIDYLKGEVLRDKVNVILRHDIDTSSCAENISLLTDLEKVSGVRSAIYVCVDDRDYKAETYVPLLRKLYEEGFELGLHTAAYIEKEPYFTVRTEIAKFKTLFGFSPQSFTTHGILPMTAKVRRDFIQYMKTADLWFLGSDDIIGYDLRTGDSYKDIKKGVTYLKKEILYLNQNPLGARVLFLTHPCYWRLSNKG